MFKTSDLKRNNFFLACSIVFILFSLSLLVFKSTWAINDDVFMAMTVSGKGFSDKPTEYIVESNIIIGSILKKLYEAMPVFPWYGIYTFFILYISFVTLLYSLLNYKYSKARIVYFLIYFIFFGVFFIRMPQFTTNAFMLGMSGMFLLLANLYDKKPLSYRIIIISILLLSLSSLIRINSFFLVVVLSLPVIVIGIVKRNFDKQVIGEIIISGILLSLIVFAFQAYNKSFYLKDDKWAYVLEKGKLRVELVDNNKVNSYSFQTRHVFDKVGWGVNDFLLMKKWFSADDKVFSKDKMEEIMSGIKDMPAERPMIYFRYMFRDIYFYGTILLMIFYIIQINEKKKNSLEIIIPIFISLSIIFYLGYYVRLPDRVYISIFSFLSFLTLFFTDNDNIGQSVKKIRNKLKFLFIFLFISYFIFLHYKGSTLQKKGNFLLKYYIAQLHPTKDRIFLVWADSLLLELISVFDNLDDFSEFRMLTTCHRFNDPIGMEILKDFDVKTFGDLIGKNNLYHIGNLEYMALYSQYLKEHYNLDVAFKINMVNPIFMVYQHVRINSGTSERLISIPVSIKGFKYTKYNIFVIQE